MFRDIDFDAAFITKWAARFTRRSHRVAPFEPELHDLRTRYGGELHEKATLQEKRLTEAENTIAAMETSTFWKARLFTARLRRMVRSK
jgi:hypothetical protein